MRKRSIRVWTRLSESEYETVTSRVKKTGLSREAYIRDMLLRHFPKEKPDDRFYAVMRELSAIGNNVNQLARKAAALGFVDAPFYKQEAEKWDAFRLEIRRKFLLPDKEVNEKLP